MSLADCLQEDAAMEDLDMYRIDGFRTDTMSDFICGDVSLSNQTFHSRLTNDAACCVVSSPVYVFIADRDKQRLAHSLTTLTSHSFLPTSSQFNRFLSTGEARRVSATSFIRALLLSNIQSVSIENYGQKSPVAHYYQLFSSLHATTTFSLDLAIRIRASSPSTIPLLYSSRPYTDNTRSLTVRRMFSDFIASSPFSNLGRVGTVEWVARDPVDVGGGLSVVRVKLYPAYVHWLKATFPPYLQTLPFTQVRLRERLRVIHNVAEKLADMSVEDAEQLRHVRAEVTVTGSCSVDIVTGSAHLLPFIRDFASCFGVVEVGTTSLAVHIQRWLQRAQDARLGTGGNAVRIRGPRLQYARQLLNEVGVATSAVDGKLRARPPSGRYEWEDDICPHRQRIAANAAANTDGDDDAADDDDDVNAATALAADIISVLTADETILEVRKANCDVLFVVLSCLITEFRFCVALCAT
jgi:hypothetical protein